jgi:prevent-host-death family protein
MPSEIGIRELKNQASTILRRVREEAVEYVITHHGRPVALLRPIQEADIAEIQREESRQALQHLLELGASLSASDPTARPAADILSEMREEENQWPL